MRKLPSGYDPVIGIYKDSDTGVQFYFDTGIVPTNNMNVNCLFGVTEKPTGSNGAYVFGARNSNSNTASGQLNFLMGNTAYFGYNNGRSSFTRTDTEELYFYFLNKDNAMQFNSGNTEIFDIERTSATFTGNRTIYVMALNNGGSPNYGTNPTLKMFQISISKDGQLVSDMVPAKNLTSGKVGLYDLVQNTFIEPSGSTALTDYSNYYEAESDGNGSAFFRTSHGEYTTMYYHLTGDNYPLLDIKYTNITIEAEPKDGYVFSHWTDTRGNVVSYDRVLHEIPSEAFFSTQLRMFLTAHFKKISTDQQKNRFMLLGIQYGEGSPSPTSPVKANEFDIYSMIKSFSIKEDGLTKTTSTIVLDSMPSAYQVNMPVAIYTDKGKFIWAGIVEAIEGNTLNCREALSILDEDFVFVPNASWGGLNLTQYTLMSALNLYTSKFFTLHTSSPAAFTDTNDASLRKGQTFYNYGESPIHFDSSLSFDNSKNVSLTMPLIEETETKNLEDYLLELFNSTGYGVIASVYKLRLYSVPNNAYSYKSYLDLNYYYPNRDTILSISDNYENISNVKVNVESQLPTVLEIYNSTGTTCRGVYGMQTDGTITDMLITEEKPLSSFIGYSNCKTAVVLSDDNLNTILVQNLTNAMFNHNITFDLDLTHGMYTLDDFPIGRRVKFYVGNKMYESVVTAKEYELAENENIIRLLKVTLGKVRNSLTAKVKLSSLKKR